MNHRDRYTRIAALQQMTVERGCTPHEADTAKALLSELLAAGGEEMLQEYDVEPKKKGKHWISMLGSKYETYEQAKRASELERHALERITAAFDRIVNK